MTPADVPLPEPKVLHYELGTPIGYTADQMRAMYAAGVAAGRASMQEEAAGALKAAHAEAFAARNFALSDALRCLLREQYGVEIPSVYG